MALFLKKIAAAAALAGFASAAFAGSALKSGNILEARLAGERIILQPHFAYTPPPIGNLLSVAGDSRSEGVNPYNTIYLSTNFQLSTSVSNNYAAWIFPASGNAFIPFLDYDFAVGTTTTAGQAARLKSPNTFCGMGHDGTTAVCYNGTAITTSGTQAVNKLTLSATAPASLTGKILGGAIMTNSLYPGSVIGTVTGADAFVPYSPNAWSTPLTGQTFYAYPAAQSTPYWNFIGANGDGHYSSSPKVSQDTDSMGTHSNFGNYSLCNNPSSVVSLIVGTNDMAILQTPSTPLYIQSLLNLTYILQHLGKSDCNKVVLLADELPRGISTGTTVGGYEKRTISGTSATVTNAAKFYQTVQLCYQPDGTFPVNVFVPGANDGYCLTPGSTSSGGQFVDAGAGVYNFNAADTGAKIGFAYTWKNNDAAAAPTGNILTTIHNFMRSTSCGSFTDPLSGVTYPLSGARCARDYPHVIGIDTWEAAIDSGSGSLFYNLPFTQGDGLHPQQYLGRKLGNLVWDSLPSWAKPSSVPYPPPLSTSNNPAFTGNISSGGTVTTSCTGGDTAKSHYITALSPAASTGLYGPSQTVSTGNGVGILYLSQSALGFASPPIIDCVDQANNQLHIKTGAANTNAGALTMALMVDPSTSGFFVPNGILDHRAIVTTAASGCSTTHCGTAGAGGTLSGAVTTNGSNVVTAATAYGASALSGSLYPSAVLTDTGGSHGSACLPAGAKVKSAYQTGGASPKWNLVMTAAALCDSTGDTITASTAAMSPTFGYPLGWSLSLQGMSFVTGGMGVSYGVMTNPDGDGFDSFDMVFQGTAGATSAITFANNLINITTSQLQAGITVGDKHRAQCHVDIYPGPNGHLWGVSAASVSAQDTSSVAFTAPYQSAASPPLTNIPNTTTTFAATFGNNVSTNTEYNDLDIAQGPVSYWGLTPPADTNGMTTPKFVLSNGINMTANAPVSATVRFKGCWAATVAQ